jgi:hypothetical protein
VSRPASAAFVEVLEVGHHPGDPVADQVVVGLEVLPVNCRCVTECAPRQPADDRDFAE